MLVKLIGVAFCAVVINVVLKQYKPEFCVLSNVCAGLIMFIIGLEGLKNVIETYFNVQEVLGFEFKLVSPILKIIGIGYITEFASDIAEESGNKSIASKVILGGKIAICAAASPVILEMLNVILSLI